MSRIRWYGPTVVLLLTVLSVMLLGPHLVRSIEFARGDARLRVVRDELVGNVSLAELNSAFRKVAEVVEPSVVHVQVYRKTVSGGPSPGEELFRRFFGPDGPNLGPNPGPMPGPRMRPLPSPNSPDPGDLQPDNPDDLDRYNVPQQFGNGSGWVYGRHDAEGKPAAVYVITNNHVVEDADRIVLRLHDGGERTARIVGTDPRTDIAVLKVEGDGKLHPAALADEPVRQGDIVFAFGSPFRFDFSMSQGIVSAKGRRLGILNGRQGYENFIQTDAAINPGNSGGPLTNIYGQVVGMNTAIATRTGTYNGLGFAIPVDMVKDVADQLITKGRVVRGYLGIFIDDLDPKMAQTFNFTGKGVLVMSPIDNGPAAKAGLQSGDIVTRLDGQPVQTAEALRRSVAAMSPGTQVKLEVFREGKTLEVTVEIGELPDQVAQAGRPAPDPAVAPGDKGLELQRKLGIEQAVALTRELAQRMGIDFTPGVLVERVRPDSAAAAQGIRPGTLIVQVMNGNVATEAELAKALADVGEGKPVRLRLLDNGVTRFVVLELPAD